MAYTPQHLDWHDKTQGSDTPIDAAALEHIEGGITATAVVADAAVPAAGNTAIAGVKAFSSSPTVPTPTTATQVAPKGYVDSVAGSGSTPHADATTYGTIKLGGGDLAGTAGAVTVPALATKITSTTTHTWTNATTAPGSPAVGDIWADIS